MGSLIRLFLFYSVAQNLDFIVCQITDPYDPTEKDCPEPFTKMMTNLGVPWGTQYRAYITLPKGLSIKTSLIPGAGVGVFADTFIPKYTWLGEYEGEVVPHFREQEIGPYAWQIRRNGELVGLIDAEYVESSTYHRFVNMPQSMVEENVISLECYTRIFYMTSRDLSPGDELLTDYGPNYAMSLGMNLNQYYGVHESWIELGVNLNLKKHRSWLQDRDLVLVTLRERMPDTLPGIVKLLRNSTS